MRTWTYTGFSVHQSFPVSSGDDQGLGRLAQYISRAPFSLKKLEYDPQKGVVVFHSKKEKKKFDPIEFIFLLQKHIPNKGEVLIRYYGFYSNVARGKRKLAVGDSTQDSDTSAPEEADIDKKEMRKRWAQLIQKIYEVNPLICQNCGSEMRIIAYIDQWDTILRILKHLELWPPQTRDPPNKNDCTISPTALQHDLSSFDADFFGS
jgi:hypothetical protein